MDFPALADNVYLDTAATCLKPRRVAEAVAEVLLTETGSVHRGASQASFALGERYAAAREAVARYFGTEAARTVFVKSATEGLNAAAHMAEPFVGAGDTIVVTGLEHHANLLPWRALAERKGARIAVAPFDAVTGALDETAYGELLALRPKVVAMTACSNVYGMPVPYARLLSAARNAGAITVLDAAQVAGHGGFVFEESGADIAALSAHKAYGPAGIGALFLAERFTGSEPWLLGGGIVSGVTERGATLLPCPERFEAGTVSVALAAGFAEGIACLEMSDLSRERRVAAYLRREVGKLPGMTVLGGESGETSLLSCVHERVHAHDIGSVLDGKGIQVRVGRHCADPLHQLLDIPATVRLSCGIYTTEAHAERAIAALKEAITFFTIHA